MFNCPICAANEIDHLLKWDDYSIYRCHSCSLVFSAPTPTNEVLREYYQGFMFRAPDDRIIEHLTNKKVVELKRLFDLKEEDVYPGSKRFLDYGGGTGVAYNAASRIGLDAYYYDLDEDSVAFVEDKFELPPGKIIRNPAETDILFDYILSDNVIEHTPDPLGFVRELYALLDEDGVLVLKTPHAGNAEAFFNPVLLVKEYFKKALKCNSLPVAFRSCFKRFWHCAPPRHLFSFSTKSLESLVVRLGIPKEACELTYYPAPFLSNTLAEHTFTSRIKFKGLKAVLLRLLALPFALVEFVLQVIARVLVSCRVRSSGGVIMKLRKIDFECDAE